MATKGTTSKSPTIRRILKEAQELALSPSPTLHASPTSTDIFSWHFTIRGPPTSVYESGIYHGRIALPPTYPLRPPSFRFMTPSGRFEVNREICLSISGHHEETWMPAWGVRTAMLALRAFMEVPSEGQVGGMDMDDASRRRLADQSRKYICAECGKSNEEILRESAEKAEMEGGKKGEDEVPRELEMGYREDIGQKTGGGASGDAESSEAAAARKARADAELARANHTTYRSATTLSAAEFEDADIRAAAARATLSQVGVTPQSRSGTSTSRAPTREDAEDIRMASMFPLARRSPIPRAQQSPNQLEPMVGSPPPAYRRPLPHPPHGQAAPGQGVPAPTGSAGASMSFQQDAFPPYLDNDNPAPRQGHSSESQGSDSDVLHMVEEGEPISMHGFVERFRREAEEAADIVTLPRRQSPGEGERNNNAGLPPELVRAQADAAARYFEALGAEGVRERARPRTEVDPDRHIRHLMEEQGNEEVDRQQIERRQQAQSERERRGSVVWIDRLIALLVTVLMLLVVRFAGIWFK